MDLKPKPVEPHHIHRELFRNKSPDGTNLRLRLTRSLLQNAFLELIKHKSFDSITVSQIAEKAQVNRATFYRHYPDKYQLVAALFADSINSLCVAVRSPDQSSSEVNESSKEFLKEILMTLLKYVAANASLYRSIFNSSANVELERYIREHTVPILKSRVEWLVAKGKPISWIGGVPQKPQSDTPYIIVVNHIIGSLRWWLMDGQEEDLEGIAEWILKFISYGAAGLFNSSSSVENAIGH